MFLNIILCFCTILLGYLFCRKPKITRGNKLPGPTPLPILGNLLNIGYQPHVTFTKWAKCYGPIYGIKLGLKDDLCAGYSAIVVTDYNLIKEMFNDTASNGRIDDNPVWMAFSKGPYGIVNSSGPTWKAQRNFAHQTLGSFGFAKTSMETMILDEVKFLLNWLKNQEGSPILGTRIFNAPVLNSLWRIISGERFSWEKSTPDILQATDDFFKEFLNVTSNGLLLAPVLRLFAPNFFGWNRYVKSIAKMLKLCRKTIAEHKKNFDSTNLRDYIDHYLLKIENETDPKSSFYKDTGSTNMMSTIFDLFVAGSETTASTLSWAMLYLSENQKVQQSLQKEIEKVIGSTTPSLSDKANLPYTAAVISEILRINPLAALGAPHRMESDLAFHGYHLPRGAIVFANIYCVHHDHAIWKDPANFRPERFLNEDQTKFVNNEALIPFSDGKRKCFGKTLARDTLFLFITGIFQKFDVLPDPDNIRKPNFQPKLGIGLQPNPFKIVVTSRQC